MLRHGREPPRIPVISSYSVWNASRSSAAPSGRPAAGTASGSVPRARVAAASRAAAAPKPSDGRPDPMPGRAGRAALPPPRGARRPRAGGCERPPCREGGRASCVRIGGHAASERLAAREGASCPPRPARPRRRAALHPADAPPGSRAARGASRAATSPRERPRRGGRRCPERASPAGRAARDRRYWRAERGRVPSRTDAAALPQGRPRRPGGNARTPRPRGAGAPRRPPTGRVRAA